MKFSNLLLASTAIPLLMLSAKASALQPQAPAMVVAQADTAEEPQQPPRTRPRVGGQNDQGASPGQQRRQGRPGADEDGGRQRPQRIGGDDTDGSDQPRRPRAASPESDAPARQRQEQRTQEPRTQEQRTQEQRQPSERSAPARQNQAPTERTRTQDDTPARPTARERDQRQGDRPRQQAPDAPVRPSSDTPARPSTAPDQPRTAPFTPTPTDRPRREQDRDRTQTEPSQQRTAPAPAQTAPAPTTRSAPDTQTQTAPAPRTQPSEPPPASAAPQQPSATPQQAAPREARPLDPSRVRIDDLRRERRERREGGRVIIEEPGNRTIIREGNSVIIRHDEAERFRRIYGPDDVRVERRGQGEEVTIFRRPDGSEIISVRDEQGNLIRRIRREPAGREVVLIENRRSGIGIRPGYGYVEEEVLRLPPPVVRIPREEYIVETERASPPQILEAFTAPPVERIERAYTLDEVRRSQPLRERMRRVDLDTINFEFGSWELPPHQIDTLRGIADGLQEAISRNPNEIFLVEGHTDAVGSDEDNLTLSDRRAETVATILTQRFQIPAENLTTQGYGEQYLKVNTQGPEAENRRVTLRRITPLLQGQNQQ